MKNKTHQNRLLILVAVMAAAFCAEWFFAAAGADAKPTDVSALHGKHLSEDLGLACDACHTDKKTDEGVLRVLPDEKSCAECHSDSPVEYKKPSPKRRDILFSHVTHADAEKVCADCHQGADKTAVKLPKHEQCVECHKEDLDATLCGKCHVDLGALGLTKLASYSHANDYVKRHGGYAQKNSKACAQCHTQSFCLDCHNKHEGLKPSLKYPEKTRANLIHRGDWETTHRFEARTDSSSCLKCHNVNACNTCHNERKAGARSDAAQFRHPEGWMQKGSKNFHGEKAEAEIVTCAACHNRGGIGDCRTCHGEGVGVNPHPENWDPKGLDKKNRMCAECHTK